MVAMECRSEPYEILITDDDEACRETLRDVMSERGYRTHLASCGQEAIEVARGRLVHVLIIDMNMPDLSGLETVTIIRREIRVGLPSILISADHSRELMLRAMRARVESFIPKPLKINVLRNIVEHIIRRTYE